MEKVIRKILDQIVIDKAIKRNLPKCSNPNLDVKLYTEKISIFPSLEEPIPRNQTSLLIKPKRNAKGEN